MSATVKRSINRRAAGTHRAVIKVAIDTNLIMAADHPAPSPRRAPLWARGLLLNRQDYNHRAAGAPGRGGRRQKGSGPGVDQHIPQKAMQIRLAENQTRATR